MCIKCVIKAAMEEMFEGANATKEVVVGKVDMVLVAEFKDNTDQRKVLELDVEIGHLQLRREIVLESVTMEEAEEKYEDTKITMVARAEKNEKEHKALWERVYAEVGITDKEAAYSIDHETGEVTMEVEEVEASNGEGQECDE